MATVDVFRRHGISSARFYKWKARYGSLEVSDAPRLRSLKDGSCIRLRPEYPGHVWFHDFVEGRTHAGRKFRILAIIGEASRECLALIVARKLRSEDVPADLAELFGTRGPPANIRSDNGPEFIANAVRQWLAKVGVQTLYITPGSPWENGYCESLKGRMRYEPLTGEIFYTLAEAKILIEAWRRHYNTIRPHSALGYRPAAPETATPPWRQRQQCTNNPCGPLSGGRSAMFAFPFFVP